MKKTEQIKKTILRSWMMTGLFLLLMLSINGQTQKAKAADISGKVSLIPSTTEMTRKNVIVSVGTKKLKVSSILWQEGKITKKSMKKWRKAKNITNKKYFTAKEDGDYSIRVQDKKKNVTCKTIYINNIDKSGPVMEYKKKVDNKVATISIVTADIPSGIGFVGYSKGYLKSKKKSDYTKAGAPETPTKITVADNDKVDATHQFKADTQGYYTIIAKDKLGNTTISHIKVKLWDELTKIFDRANDGYSSGFLKGTFYDRWDNTVTNPLGLLLSSSGKYYVEFFLNGGYKRFSGTITRDGDISDEDIVWLEILVDDRVVYTSDKMDYKSKAISFDVAIDNGKYMEIRAYWTGTGHSTHEYLFITNDQLYN